MRKQTAARISLALALAFVGILGVLHFLEPEFNLGGHLISEYELGTYGWLMSLAFFCLGGACLFLLHAVRDELRGTAGVIGFWWLAIVAIAYVGAGFFYPDESTGLGLPADPAVVDRGAVAPTLNAALHGIFGVIVIFSSPIVFTLLHRSLAANPRWASRRRTIGWVTVASWMGLVMFLLSLVAYTVAQEPGGFDFRSPVSIINRLMILAYAAWLATTAWPETGLQRSLTADH